MQVDCTDALYLRNVYEQSIFKKDKIMGFLDLLLLGAVFNGFNKKDHKRTNNYTQSSSYNYGYEDGYEDGYNSHSCECDDYHDSYDSSDYLNCDCDHDY